MTIKEMVDLATSIIGRKDVKDFLNGKDDVLEETLKVVDDLVALSGLVIKELSATFIPMYKKEKISSQNGEIYYVNLSQKVAEIVGVYDVNGKKVDYEITPEYIKVGGGEFLVEYEVVPPNYTLNDEIGYMDCEVPLVILSYGLVAEYYVCTGRFEQAVMWHERYVDAINSLRKTKNLKVKTRSFI